MPRYDRSGTRIGTARIGRWTCLRQELLHAGERWSTELRGFIRAGALREQLSMPVHVTLLQVWTPLRFLDDGWVDIVKEGVDSSGSLDTYTTPTGISEGVKYDCLGIGSVEGGDTIGAFWVRNTNKVREWHLKWPQDSVISTTAALSASDTIARYGWRALNLPSLHTRFMDISISSADYELVTEQSSSREKFDVRDLTLLRARLGSEQKRDWLGWKRYNEILHSVWRARGSHNAEEVPYVINDQRQWMGGQNIWAQDGASLGNIAGIMNFDISHRLPRPFVAPEHGVWSYWLALRCPPVFEDQASPFAALDDFSIYELLAEPEYIGRAEPKRWRRRQLKQLDESSSFLGYLPRGQEWRTGWNHVDGNVDKRNSFMVQSESVANSVATLRYHQDLTRAFRSQSLGDCLFRIDFLQSSGSRVPPPMRSIMTGALG